MKTIEFLIVRLGSGEAIELRKVDGAWACPVCGANLSGVSPYDIAGRGSQESCQRCKTQFGADDDACGADTVQGRWKALRFDFLKKSGWRPEVLIDLVTRLYIDIDELKQAAEMYERQCEAKRGGN